ncbi:hypothetical protein AURDEDRAFT_176864 [Auricularia subglabra TFB-10046 SS5]|uniref:Uncharacterized protein n=1 Tax=Auricularia subglabra (strain TFB-10046 / SS5) TaxID=717982 RepID=J0D5N1_AURST|nr:hypothetical protein AURDEDRAFT_176864 [Auricularia subglabra TFB-10046 SS5]
MTNSNMKPVVLRVVVDDISQLAEGDLIVRRTVELASLNSELKEYEKKCFATDARLSHFAIGSEPALKTRA